MGEIPTFPLRPSRLPKVLLFGFIGVLSGALGTFIVYWFFPQLRQAVIPPGSQSIIIQEPGKIIVEESSKLGDIAVRTIASIVNIYPANSAIKVGGRQYFSEKKLAGSGVIVTNNGWLVTAKGVHLAKKDFVIV